MGLAEVAEVGCCSTAQRVEQHVFDKDNSFNHDQLRHGVSRASTYCVRSGHTTTSRPSSAHPPGSSPSASSSRPTSAAAASPAAAQVDLAEARRAHTAAAERLGEVQAACQQLDQQMEALEVELQQVLVSECT